MKYAQLVMGPAGAGKSTYCATIQRHCESIQRTVHVVNLDPAAEYLPYEPSLDIRDLISSADVAEELKYGPNGALVYCMEFLMDNLDWFEEALGSYEEEYLIVDLPGQIELYTHIPVIRNFVSFLERQMYRMCAVYMVDSQFVSDSSKFFAVTLTAMSAMLHLKVPHVNVLTKVDLLPKAFRRRYLDRYLSVDTDLLAYDAHKYHSEKWRRLNDIVAQMIDEYSLVVFIPYAVDDEFRMDYMLAQIDNAMQYGEHEEPQEPKELDPDLEGEENAMNAMMSQFGMGPSEQ
eukprot:Clim_evm20s253 gene=Clim_evmTU20s253